MKMVHVTINVRDLEESINFYEDVLDLKILGDLRQFGKPIVFLAEEGADTKVELIENKEETLNCMGISMGFNVDDLDAHYEKVKGMGYEVTDMISPMPNVRFFFITDPNGMKVQVCHE